MPRGRRLLLLAFWVPLVLGAAEPGDPGPRVEQLRIDVNALAGEIGPRGVFAPDDLKRSADYIVQRFTERRHKVRRLGYAAGKATVENLELEIPGSATPAEIVVVGAHYDTVPMTPGADDNASGVAVLLSLADYLAASGPHRRTVRLVAFPNEEPAYFQTELMGSRVYARACRARGDKIVAMVSIESVGYYSDRPASQRYPAGVESEKFPSTGNFLALVGNIPSTPLLERASAAFRRASDLPVVTAALPEQVEGAGWSDHWSFWREGYRAIMATDTAHLRNPHYHRVSDRPDTLDYPRLAAVAAGLRGVLEELARGD